MEWLLGEGANQPGALFGIGYNFDVCLIAAKADAPGTACGPLLVGVICIALLFGLAILGVRIAFAAAISGLIGMIEMIGFDPGAATSGRSPMPRRLCMRCRCCRHSS